MPRLTLYALLALGGSCWGLTIPLTKISVSTGHQPFGLIFWQLALSAIILATILLVRRKPLFPAGASLSLLIFVGLVGTNIPNSFSYWAAANLPAGVLAVVIALVPMFALPMAIALGRETVDPKRMFGVLLGAAAVILIVGPPTSLPESASVVFVFIAMIAPFCYGLEGNVVAIRGTGILDPMQLLFGASIVSFIFNLPIMLATSQFVNPLVAFGAAEMAIVANAGLHVIAYSLYLWLVGRAGAVFTSQISYLVTGTAVLWSMVLLSETYSVWIWTALALMLVGIALVQPRSADASQ